MLNKISFVSFFKVAENRTFDYRQRLRVIHKHPTPNKDIVVLAIDDASLESLWDKYGEWPLPRNVYGDLIPVTTSENGDIELMEDLVTKTKEQAEAEKAERESNSEKANEPAGDNTNRNNSDNNNNNNNNNNNSNNSGGIVIGNDDIKNNNEHDAVIVW